LSKLVKVSFEGFNEVSTAMVAMPAAMTVFSTMTMSAILEVRVVSFQWWWLG
jgi:hypothetical protein